MLRQRHSQKPHAVENITYLSLTDIMHYISRFLPGAGANVKDIASMDLTLKYLFDPSLYGAMGAGLKTKPFENFDEIDGEVLSQKLAQVLNTFIHIGQMPNYITARISDSDDEGNQVITVPDNTINLVTKFYVPRIWIILCFFSCVLPLTGGVDSVVFAHMAIGPEVLGFASTAIRGNKHIILPEEISAVEGTEVTSALKDMRIRFGVIRGVAGEKISVGLQESVSRIKDELKTRRR